MCGVILDRLQNTLLNTICTINRFITFITISTIVIAIVTLLLCDNTRLSIIMFTTSQWVSFAIYNILSCVFFVSAIPIASLLHVLSLQKMICYSLYDTWRWWCAKHVITKTASNTKWQLWYYSQNDCRLALLTALDAFLVQIFFIL